MVESQLKKMGNKIDKAFVAWKKLKAKQRLGSKRRTIKRVRQDLLEANRIKIQLDSVSPQLPSDLADKTGMEKGFHRCLAQTAEFIAKQSELLEMMLELQGLGENDISLPDGPKPLATSMLPPQTAPSNLARRLVVRQAKDHHPTPGNIASPVFDLSSVQHLGSQRNGPETRNYPIVSATAAQDYKTAQRKLLTPIQSWLQENATPVSRETSSAYSKVKIEDCEAIDVNVPDSLNPATAPDNINSIRKTAACEAIDTDVADAADLEKALGNIDSIR